MLRLSSGLLPGSSISGLPAFGSSQQGFGSAVLEPVFDAPPVTGLQGLQQHAGQHAFQHCQSLPEANSGMHFSPSSPWSLLSGQHCGQQLLMPLLSMPAVRNRSHLAGQQQQEQQHGQQEPAAAGPTAEDLPASIVNSRDVLVDAWLEVQRGTGPGA
jgi:hypothetical protein